MRQIGSVRQIVATFEKRNGYLATACFGREMPLPCKSANTAARCTAMLSISTSLPTNARVLLASCHCLATAPTQLRVEINDGRAHLHCAVNGDRWPRR